MDINEFEKDLYDACMSTGGVSLRKWIHNKQVSNSSSLSAGCCPMLALPADHDRKIKLTSDQFWSFAHAYDGRSREKASRLNYGLGNWEKPVDEEFFNLGLKFRQLVLAGEFDGN